MSSEDLNSRRHKCHRRRCKCGPKYVDNLVVKEDLTVCNDASVKGDAEVCGNLTLKGELIVDTPIPDTPCSIAPADRPFLNRTNRLLSEKKIPFGSFLTSTNILNYKQWVWGPSFEKVDWIVYEGEHFLDFGKSEVVQFMANMRNVAQTVQPVPEGRTQLENRITPIVRVPQYGRDKLEYLVKEALDQGAMGIMFAHIENKEQALRAVKSMRYPDAPCFPRGTRGTAGSFTPGIYFWGVSPAEYAERADVYPLNPKGDLTSILQIENQAGVDNIEEIISVPGISAIFIGGTDLFIGGTPPRDPVKFEENVQKIVDACNNHDPPIPVGGFNVSLDLTVSGIERGETFMMSTLDQGLRDTNTIICAGWEAIEQKYPPSQWRHIGD